MQRSPPNTPAPFCIVLILLTLAPQSVHAQSASPTSTSNQPPFDLSGYGIFGIITGGVVGLVVLCACCSLVCFKERKPQRVPVSRDVEAPVLHLDQIQAQADNLPASLPQAHTKIEVVGAAGEWELSPPPPPYYPPPPNPPPPGPALQRAITMPAGSV